MIERLLNRLFKKTIKTNKTNLDGLLPSERRTLWGTVIALILLNIFFGWYIGNLTEVVDKRIEVINQLLPGMGPAMTFPPVEVNLSKELVLWPKRNVSR